MFTINKILENWIFKWDNDTLETDFNLGTLCANKLYENGSYMYQYRLVHIRTCKYTNMYIYVHVHTHSCTYFEIGFSSGTMIP